MALRLMFLGPPGAGKGTYAKRVAKALSIPTISSGEILREEARSGSDLALPIQRGELVPDARISELMNGRLARDDAATGFLLDGYPRTIKQARYLDSSPHGPLSMVVYVVLGEEYLIAKLNGRRLCSCGISYNVAHVRDAARGVDMPALLPQHGDSTRCECGKPLQRREDDTADVIKHRLHSFRVETTPLLDYYAAQGVLRCFEVKRGLADMPVLEDFISEACYSSSAT